MHWMERLNRESAGRIAVGGDLTVEVLNWAYNPHLPDNILHRHTYFEVCLVGQWGSGRFRVKSGVSQTEHPIGPGDLFIARPGVLHQIVNDGSLPPMELLWLSFHAPLETAKQGKGGASPIAPVFDYFSRAASVLVVPESKARSVAAVWNALRVTASATGDTTAGSLQMVSLTAALLLAIAEAGGNAAPLPPLPRGGDPGGPPQNDRLARQAVQYIHQHLSRPLPIGEIADYLAVSPRHLARLLTAYTGVAPHHYVEQARLDRARTLLLRTDDPIKQVALLSGYGDVAHFTRAFSRRFGCPPGAFRQSGGQADKTVRGPDMKTPGALI